MSGLQQTEESVGKNDPTHTEHIDGVTRCNQNAHQDLIQMLEETFQTREELLNGVQNFFSAQGYATSIKHSKKDQYITIGCDRGGIYRDMIGKEKRERKTSTRLINCPFEIHRKKQIDGFWKLEMRNNSHNHEPSIDMSGHPSCRRLSKEDIASVGEMTLSGIAPRQIVSSLRLKNPNIQIVSRTVYNAKNKILRVNLAGRSVLQALFEELRQEGFIYDVRHDLSGSLTHLFFAHPASILLSRSYSNVFVMDCTYKTNRYKMPLLDIIGISSFNTSFYAGFVFLIKEREEDYTWALQMFKDMLGPDCHPSVFVTDRELTLMNAIKFIFPLASNLLCIWHIEKNILAKCKKSHLEDQDDINVFLLSWNGVLNAKSEIDFNETWKLFEFFYKDNGDIIKYIIDTWLPYKKMFVKAWTEKCLHFGNRASSRAESAHSKLKKYLQVSTRDLHQVKNKICLAIENEHQEIKTQLSSEKLRVPHACNLYFFKDVVKKVSVFALRALLNQYEMIKDGKVPLICSGHFMATMGLPCSHKMRDWKDGVLPLTFIHPQWRIDHRSLACLDKEMTRVTELKELLNQFEDTYQYWPSHQKENAMGTISQLLQNQVPSLIEPTIQPHKGRPSMLKKRKESNSTRRDPSFFEIVEATRKCKTCKTVGHNSSTCQWKGKDNYRDSFCVLNSVEDENRPFGIDLNFMH